MIRKLSVIILTYNADWNKLRATLQSILDQRFVDYEIVFADDGSRVKWNDRLEEVMAGRPSIPWRFADSPENVGTVKNAYNALNAARGEYAKLISPGDCLYDPDVLGKWIAFMEQTGAKVSFGKVVYYSADPCIQLHPIMTQPNLPSLYDDPKLRPVLFVDYLVNMDYILGASVLVKRDVMLEYLAPLVGHVVYEEDSFMRLMVYAGEPLHWFPELAVWYEFGVGISTGNNDTWLKRLNMDDVNGDRRLREVLGTPCALARRFNVWLSLMPKPGLWRKIVKLALFPWLLKLKRIRKKERRYAPTDVPTDYLATLLGLHEEASDETCK